MALRVETDDSTPTLWRGRPAWTEYIFLWFFSVMALTRAAFSSWIEDPVSFSIFAGGSAAFVGLAWFLRSTTEYVLTRQAVYRSAGFFGRGRRAIPIGTIASVEIEQGPLDRLFGIGAVVVEIKETGRRERLRGVPEPDVVRSKISALL
jgi:hypothetical protein